MKFLIAMCFLLLVAVTYGTPAGGIHPRGCIYIMGKCHRECEVGTQAYALGCGHKVPEATCDEPNPQPESAVICDYSACYCAAPTVRDTATGKCVPFSECPKKKE